MGFCTVVLLLCDNFQLTEELYGKKKLTKCEKPLPNWEDCGGHGLVSAALAALVPPADPDHNLETTTTKRSRRKPHHFAIRNNSSLEPVVGRFSWSTVLVVLCTGCFEVRLWSQGALSSPLSL
jgi:hypothetical protein